MRIRLFTIPALLIPAAAPGLWAGEAVDIAGLLSRALTKYDVPALAAVIVHRHGEPQCFAVGLRKAGEAAPVKVSDQFHIGSNAKAMTALLIAQLVDQGKLSWQSTPLDLFPELRKSANAAYASVTLLDLLSHRAGVPGYLDTDDPEFRELKPFSGSPAERRRQFALWVLSRPPAVAPRSKRLYSNAGYSIAAAMAEQAVGQPWESMIVEKLFKPLHIEGGFGWPAAGNAAQPWGHVETEDGVVPHDPATFRIPMIIRPAGDVKMSLLDYGRFLQVQLKGLHQEDTIVSAQAIRRLHTPVDTEGTGLGWGVREFEGGKATVHSGSAGTFQIVAAVFHDRDLALAVAANAGDKRALSACTEILKELARIGKA